MPLQPFNETEACPKCGGKNQEVRYENANQPGFSVERDWDTVETERLKVRCLRCGYEYLRSPLA